MRRRTVTVMTQRYVRNPYETENIRYPHLVCAEVHGDRNDTQTHAESLRRLYHTDSARSLCGDIR